MNDRWHLADLLDLEYFFGCDEYLRRQEGEQALDKRDRVIYLARIAPKLQNMPRPSSRELIHRWLQVRRHGSGDDDAGRNPPLPGTLWREVFAVFTWLALLFGLCSGLALAGAFLVYSGKAPLNVSAFLGLFVGLQLLFLLLQGLFFLLRRLRPRREAPLLCSLLMRLAAACADWLQVRARRNLPAEQRLDFAALLGRLRSRSGMVPLFVWPFFSLLQCSAIGFNLGILALTLAKVVFSDMAFGWQSSLQLSAQQVAEGVRLLALPWSWLLPAGLGYPSPAQVEGTQIILKDGIYHLATQDLVSWWPFLCMALLVYGLLPRLVLLVGGSLRQRRRLDRLELHSLEGRRLLQRMTTPLVDSSGEAAVEQVPGRRGWEAAEETPPPAGAVQGSAFSHGLCSLVLVPEELLAGMDSAMLRQAVLRLSGGGEVRVQALPFTLAGEQVLLEQIQNAHAARKLGALVLVQEAWMPPLQETHKLLAQLRRATAAQTPLTILLIGKGRGGTEPVQPEHAAIWRKKTQALADPFLEIRTLTEAP